jgi:hypothetical protein
MNEWLPENEQTQMGDEQRSSEQGIRALPKNHVQRRQQGQQQPAPQGNQAGRQCD